MVMAEDPWLFQHLSASQLPNLTCTDTLLQHGQQNALPSSMNHTVSADVAFPGFRVRGVCCPETGKTSIAHGTFQCLPSHMDSLPSTLIRLVKEEPYALHSGHGVKATPNAVSTQKRFVIFDQSGSHTRLFFSPLCYPAQNLIGGQPTKMDHTSPIKPAIHEKSDENQIFGKGSEMHEDTEEINALLYSDDDLVDSDDDEVTSTGHSPYDAEGSYKKRKLVDEITAGVASSDGLMKSQRLIDGGHKKSSLMDPLGPVKLDTLCEHDRDAESSCSNGRTQGEDVVSILGSRKKDKIRETLKILETLIPGVKSKEPLVVIDEAISYLKFLKLKAKALGVS